MNDKTLLNKKLFCLLMAAGTGSALMTGCSGSSGFDPEASTEESAIVDYTCFSNPENQKKIYVILKNYHGDYWKKVITGISDAADEIDASIYLGGIDNETDIDGQISLIEQAVKQKIRFGYLKYQGRPLIPGLVDFLSFLEGALEKDHEMI